MAKDTVGYLGAELGYRFFSDVVERSRDARAIHDRLVDEGLQPQPERSQLFTIFSRDSLKSVAISITPFVSEDLRYEAGLSLSEGGHAQAVIVEIVDKVRLGGFRHLAISDGEVVMSEHRLEELRNGDEYATDEGIRAVAERVGKIKAPGPLVEIEARQARSLASVAYNGLLADDFAATVHDEREIAALRAHTSLVAEIGLFVLFRTEGSSCCSCSCSCWGSSSCSTSSVG
jgi:hypothetical protein